MTPEKVAGQNYRSQAP